MRSAISFGLLALLSSCAPMMVTRTPEPAAPGTFDVTVSAGYPQSLTTPLCDQPDLGARCNASFGTLPGYFPLGSPLAVMVAQGLEGQTELNYTLSAGQFFGLPVLRVGGKTLFYDEAVKLAADYGIFAGFTNGGLDVGLLASMPLEGAELYGALRGFGNLTYSSASYGQAEESFSGFTGALTVGIETEVSVAQGFFAELTVATSNYNGVYTEVGDPANPRPVEVQQIGFSILPAIGFRF